MKIVHVHPSSQMASIFVVPLTESELRHGYETKIITFDVLKKFRNQIALLEHPNSNSIIFYPWRIYRLFSTLRRYRPDMLVSHNSVASCVPLLIAKILRVRKKIYFNHGVPSVAYTGLVGWVLRIIEKVNCALADNIITVSRDMKDILDRDFLHKSPSAQIIGAGSACGVDLELMGRVRSRRDKFRATLGFDPNDFVIAYVGRPKKRKGFNLLLEIWQKFVDRREGHKLLLVGSSRMNIDKVYQGSLKDVLATGFVDNPLDYIVASDVLVLPSAHEGLSYVCLESLAVGTPVVASDIPGVRALISHGESGLLVQKLNAEDFFASIEQIRENPLLADKLRRAGFEVAKKYDREKFVRDYVNFIEANLQ